MGNILIDARVIGKDGIGRFTRNIIHWINANAPERLIFLVRNKAYFKEFASVYQDLSGHYTKNEVTVINDAVEYLKPQLIHCTDYRVPFEKTHVPLIVSIHDIFRYTDISQCYEDDVFIGRYGKIVFDEMVALTGLLEEKIKKAGKISLNTNKEEKRAHYKYYSAMLEWALIIADVVVTPTKAVRNDILRNFKTQTKLKVIYYGINHIDENYDAVEKKLNQCADVFKPYFLYVGQYRKHKNVDLLVDAFSKFTQTENSSKLVLVGKDFENCDEIKHKINAYGLESRVIPLGYVSDADLSTLFQNAISLIHLASHEGFGFTPLEALKNKCSVIVAKNPVSVELLSNYAKFVDIGNIASIIDAMLEATVENQERFSSLGPQSRHFLWETTALKFLNLYKEVINQ